MVALAVVSDNLFTRATRLLYAGSRDESSSSASQKPDHLDEKSLPRDGHGRPWLSSPGGTNGSRSAALEEDIDRRRHTRTLPLWIHSLNQDDLDNKDDTQEPPNIPERARAADHNFMPAPHASVDDGRKHGQHDSSLGHRSSKLLPNTASRWQAFARASTYPRDSAETSEIVRDDWIEQHYPDLDRPWQPGLRKHDMEKEEGIWLFSGEKRNAKARRLQRTMMKNPFVPLILRLVILTFVVAALALGAWIYRETSNINARLPPDTNSASLTDPRYVCQQQTSTYMAFIVCSIAVIYLLYITWDEYFSKPLGLRSSRAKMRLLFLDLFFIVFSAANLTLAFATMRDQQWACYADRGGTGSGNNTDVALQRNLCVHSNSLCNRQKALASVLLVALFAWLLTFATSVLRVVERISR